MSSVYKEKFMNRALLLFVLLILSALPTDSGAQSAITSEIAPTGKLVKRAPAAAESTQPPASTTPTDTTDDGSKGGGYDYG